MKINVAMLGPRMHYAVPRILASAGLLEHFFTDSYSGSKPRSRAVLSSMPTMVLPGFLRRWLGRVATDIPNARITSFEWLGWKYAYKRARAQSSKERSQVFADVNEEFGLACVANGILEADAIWGFNSASLEIFSAAKKKGKYCILEQTILPRSLEDKLMQEARKSAPFNQAEDQKLSTDNPLTQREEQEWALADLIVAGSQFVFNGLIECGVPPHKIRVIPYGVDATKFSVLERHPPEGKLNILFVGEVGLRKGAHDLVEAIKLLPERTVQAKFAGQIRLPQDYVKRAPDSTNFLGPVPRSEMRALYEWADVFVLPSYVEGSATVTYEAILAGLPIITTESSGSIIKDKAEGFIVSTNSPAEIADALRQYSQTPELWAQHARASFELRHSASIERYAQDLIAAVSSIPQGA